MRTVIWKKPCRSKICTVVIGIASSVCFIGIVCVYSFLPIILREAGALHLFKVIVQHQRFIGSQDTHVAPISQSQPDPPELAKLIAEQEEHLKWLQEFSLNGTGTDLREETRPFQLNLSPRERALQLWTFEVFTRVCREAGLTYILVEGTLLGAYRHHGFVPWDDDLDVVMNGSEWRRVQHALSSVPGFGLHAPHNVQWKFFPLVGTPMAAGPYTYPYVDIFFFAEDDTHLWALTWALKPCFLHRKSDVYPLQLRPFEHLMVNVPCNFAGVVTRRYNTEWCQTNLYDHRDGHDSARVFRLPCSRLHPTLPFVFRQHQERMRTTTEVLKIGSTVMRTVTLPEVKCESVLLPLTHGGS